MVVGGAVRDVLLGRHPKDFDLVTSAKPDQVKTLFRNARVIGRRFRLAELRFPNMSVEIATFRGAPQLKQNGVIKRDNAFGTPAEDAFRRDFTVNALSYDVLNNTLYDYVGGLQDIEDRIIRTIKPPKDSILEDPVRMLRAVRFKVRLGFDLDPRCESAIRESVNKLGEVTRHRLSEEIQRFLTRGNAVAMYTEFDRLDLLPPLLALKPHPWFFTAKALANPLPELLPLAQRLDEWMENEEVPVPPTVAQLSLLLTLAKADIREMLILGKKQPAKGMISKISKMMGEWGLLNGQVEPAMRILEAAQRLIGLNTPQKSAKGNSKGNGKHPRPMTGEREAWMLLNLLGAPLGLKEDFLRSGLNRLHGMPDLPILDHPRPRRLASGNQKTGNQKTGIQRTG